MDVGGWLRSLGLEQYETAFQANAVNADVLRDLTDQDLKKLGVLLGHRPKLLRAIAALDSALGPASAPRDTPLPIPPQAILAAAAKRATHERQRRQDHSVSSSPQPFLMPNRLRSAEIDDRFLPSLEALRLLLAASDDRDDDNVQAAETGEVHGSPRWRHHLAIVIAVIAVLGLGAVGAFAYRAVRVGAVLPAPPSIVEAEGAPNENVPTDGDNQPSDLSQMSEGNAGSSKEFVSRFPADDQEPPEMAPTSPNPIASQSAPGSAVIPMVAAPSALPPSIAPPATSLPKVAARYPHRLP